jgi:hypothetical protein
MWVSNAFTGGIVKELTTLYNLSHTRRWECNFVPLSLRSDSQ